MIPPIRRNAFTLVELLVVTGLLASLLSLVIVAMRPTAESQVRELTRNLQSALMQAQTRSLTNAQGACLVIVPSSTVASGTAYFAEPRPTLSTKLQAPTGGPAIDTILTGTPSLFRTGSATAAFVTPDNADLQSLESGYRTRFSTGSTYGPWYDFSFTAYETSGTTALALLTRPLTGVDPANDIWPAVIGNQVACLVARYPQFALPAVTAPKMAAIDLRYSGAGDQPAPLSFATSNSEIYRYAALRSRSANEYAPPYPNPPLDSIGFEFDRSGTLVSLIRITPPSVKRWAMPIAPTAPIYLLVATTDDIAANRSLQSSVSTWIAVNPRVGSVRIGKNNPADWPPTAGLGKEALEQTYADWFRERRANVR